MNHTIFKSELRLLQHHPIVIFQGTEVVLEPRLLHNLMFISLERDLNGNDSVSAITLQSALYDYEGESVRPRKDLEIIRNLLRNDDSKAIDRSENGTWRLSEFKSDVASFIEPISKSLSPIEKAVEAVERLRLYRSHLSASLPIKRFHKAKQETFTRFDTLLKIIYEDYQKIILDALRLFPTSNRPIELIFTETADGEVISLHALDMVSQCFKLGFPTVHSFVPDGLSLSLEAERTEYKLALSRGLTWPEVDQDKRLMLHVNNARIAARIGAISIYIDEIRKYRTLRNLVKSDDSVKICRILAVAQLCDLRGKIDTSLKLSVIAVKMCRLLSPGPWLMESLYVCSTALWRLHRGENSEYLPLAQQYSEEGIEIASFLNDAWNMLRFRLRLGTIFFKYKNRKSQEFFELALAESYQKVSDVFARGRAHLNLGLLYYEHIEGRALDGEDNFKQAYNIASISPDAETQVNALCNLMLVEYDNARKRNFIRYTVKALSICREASLDRLLPSVIEKFVLYCILDNRHDRAAELFCISRELRRRQNTETDEFYFRELNKNSISYEDVEASEVGLEIRKSSNAEQLERALTAAQIYCGDEAEFYF